MIYPMTAQLSGWLRKDGFDVLADQSELNVNTKEFEWHLEAVKRTRPESEWADAAVFRCSTSGHAVEVKKETRPETILIQQDYLLKAHAKQVDEAKALHGEHDRRLDEIAHRLANSESVIRQHVTVGNESIRVNLKESIESVSGLVMHGANQLWDDIQLNMRGIHAEDRDERLALAKRASRQAWIRFAILVALLLLLSVRGHSQNVNPATVVATCATPPVPYPIAGNRAPLTTDTNGNLCAGVTVSATVSTAGLVISFGAGTSGGNTGPAYPAAVYSTSAAPSYTEGKFNALSSDLSGNLRVNASVTVPGSLTVTTPLGGGSGTVTVVGSASDGTTATFSPVLTAGIDDSSKVQTFRTTAAGNTVVSLETTSGVIGHIVADTGSTTAVTGNVTVVQPTGTNLHAVLDTTSTTAVTQATGTNLHAVLDTTSTTAVTQATGTNLHAVIDSGAVTVSGGTVNIQGVTGGVAVAVSGATGGTQTEIATDTVGRQIVTGATPTGGVTQGNPVAVAIGTGSNSYAMAGDTAGRPAIVGATPSGGITQGAPVLIAGATGGNTYSLTADANGHFLSHPPLYNTVWNATALGALVNVSNTSGNVLAWLDCQNSSTTANAFVQVFNVPATSVTLGTTVATEVHMVPFGGGFVLPNMNTLYQNAISIASTTTATGASTQASVCTARVTPQ